MTTVSMLRKRAAQFTTNNIGSGTLVAALLQCSSAVSLMVLTFVGAGVLNMQKAGPSMMAHDE